MEFFGQLEQVDFYLVFPDTKFVIPKEVIFKPISEYSRPETAGVFWMHNDVSSSIRKVLTKLESPWILIFWWDFFLNMSVSAKISFSE